MHTLQSKEKNIQYHLFHIQWNKMKVNIHNENCKEPSGFQTVLFYKKKIECNYNITALYLLMYIYEIRKNIIKIIILTALLRYN